MDPTALVGVPGFAFDDDRAPVEAGAGFDLADDVMLWPYAIVCSGTARPTRVGPGTRIGHRAQVGHDAAVGARVTLCPGVIVAGWAEIEDDVYVGIGALIRNRVRIGRGAFVGMGAVVMGDVPPNCVVAGNPARFLKLRTPSPDLRHARWNGAAARWEV